MLVHALISTRVDYCNSILHRVADVHLRPFHAVGTERCLALDRPESLKMRHFGTTFSDCLWFLQWFPQRIRCKLCLLVYKRLHHNYGSIMSLCDMCPNVDWSCSSITSISCQRRSTDRPEPQAVTVVLMRSHSEKELGLATELSYWQWRRFQCRWQTLPAPRARNSKKVPNIQFRLLLSDQWQSK